MKITAEIIKKFVQKNDDYYVRAFNRVQERKLSWNWAAFFLGAGWMLYRQMYMNAFLFWMFSTIVELLSSVWAKKNFSNENVALVKGIVKGILFLIQGFLGNILYLFFLRQNLRKGHLTKGVNNLFFVVCIYIFVLTCWLFFAPLLTTALILFFNPLGA